MSKFLSRCWRSSYIAWADMRHDWILTLCVMCALLAVFAPILFIFGLKNGAVETLRERLVQDPRNLEIKPQGSQSLSREWFQKLGQRADIAFLIPTTRSISATVGAYVLPSGPRTDVDLVPTAANDPLLLQNGSVVPQEGQVVLTARTAQELDAKIGDRIALLVSRRRANVEEAVKVILVVVGISQPRAGMLRQIYTPLSLIEAVERYKDGFSVPALGWPGDLDAVHPAFDEVIIIISAALSQDEQTLLLVNSGFGEIKELDSEACLSRSGVRPGPGRSVYLLDTRQSTIGNESIALLQNRLSGKNPLVLPLVRPLELTLGVGNSLRQVSIRNLPPASTVLPPDVLEIKPSEPWSGQRLLFARGQALASVPATLIDSRQPLSFTVATDALSPGDDEQAWAPTDFMGALREAQLRPVQFDSSDNAFIYSRQSYAGFRLYARSLNDVEPLRLAFASEGIAVYTEAERIADVETLDRSLDQIFWILAGVAALGAAATLTASLCSSVIRKSREICVLKLLGLGTFQLLIYPLTQALIFASVSFIGAWMFVMGAGRMTDHLFRNQLESGESFLHLSKYQLAVAFGSVCALSIFASLAAGAYVFSLDLAEGLRDE